MIILLLSIFAMDEILHIYINRTIIPPRYKIIIEYISQLKFILKNLILIIIELTTNIKQDINNELEKQVKKIITKNTIFHKNINL